MNNLSNKSLLCIAGIIVILVVMIVFNVQSITKLTTVWREVSQKKTELENQIRTIEEFERSQQKQVVKHTIEKHIYEPLQKTEQPEIAYNTMLDAIMNFAKTTGIRIRTIQMTGSLPETDIIKREQSEAYTGTLLQAQVVGTYTELQNFLREIYRYDYLINISKIKIDPYEKNKKILVIDLELCLYSKV